MKITDFSYHLPPEKIAHTPANPRDGAKLLVLDRQGGLITDQHIYNLPEILTSNDVLVLNQTKVFPARIYGTKDTGGKVEILLLNSVKGGTWKALCKPGLNPGTIIHISDSFKAQCVNKLEREIILKFNLTGNELTKAINKHGTTPLPPYIHTPLSPTTVKARYQTVFAKNTGSAAAPTAGLHFTTKLLDQLKNNGVVIEFVTLHVGLGTFKPLTPDNISSKTLHSEHYHITSSTALRLNEYKQKGKRIVAVGTTTLRTLESAVNSNNSLTKLSGETNIFISPPFKFKFVDALITNFHLPESSLLMLVSAFTTSPNTIHSFKDFLSTPVGHAYQHAINSDYRFFSFGDAMYIA